MDGSVSAPPALTLVLATIGRRAELARFLDGLAAQTFADFDLIVVDQSGGGDVAAVLAEHGGSIRHVHLTTPRGISRGKNIGLARARGDVVTFPDDDCAYPPDLLERAMNALAARPSYAGVAGAAVDEEGRFSTARWDARGGEITRFNVWNRAIEFSVFVRRPALEAIGGYDEEIGAGAGTKWGSNEGTELLIRALDAGYALWYDPTLQIFHAEPVRTVTPSHYRRAIEYGRGMGHVLRMHRYPPWFVAYQLVRPLGGAGVALVRGDARRARFRWRVFRGRLDGWVTG